MAGNIKGIIVEIGGDTSGLQKALSKVNSVTSDLSKELRSVNSLLKLDPQNTELLEQKQKLLSKSIEVTQDKLKQLQKIKEEADKKMSEGTNINEENYRTLQREIIKTQKNLSSLKKGLELVNSETSNWVKAGKKVEEFGNKVEKVSDKINNIGNKTSIVSAGLTGIGAMLITTAGTLETAVDKYIATTNTAIDKTETYKKVIKEINDKNLGNGYEDIANAMSSVTMQIKNLNESDLKNITEQAIVLRDLFGYEVNESIRAVKALIDNFNISAEDAFDLIIQGKNQGLDFSNELLDNVNEYSVQFNKLGLSAQDMFNIFKVGAENGAFNLDKIGDAVKEFSIRTIDGSNTTIDGFKRIGLNADEMTKKFAKGGEEAKQAFIEVVNRLGNMDDKVSQSMAGVDLFGTMWEDLGPTVVTSFSKMDNGIKQSSNTMQESIDTLYNSTQKRLEKIIKKVTNLGSKLGDKLLPVIEDLIDKAVEFVDGLEEMSDEELDNVIKIGLMVAAFGPAIKIIGKLTNTIGTGIKSLGKYTQKIGELDVAAKTTNSSLTKVTSSLGSFAGKASLVAGGTTLIIGGLMALDKKINETYHNSKEKTDNLINSLKNEVETRQDIIKNKNEMISSNLSEIKHTESLKKELDKLVESNGKVKEGYESRANFILNELNKALETEYSMTGNMIKQYNELSNTIDDLIIKKEAQIVLESNEEKFKNAIDKRTEAYKNYNATQDELLKVKREIEDINKKPYIFEGSRLNDLKEAEKQYKELASILASLGDEIQEYDKDIVDYEENTRLALEGGADNYKKIVNSINDTTVALKDGNAKNLRESLKNTQEYIEEQKKYYDIDLKLGIETNRKKYEENIKSGEQQVEQLAQNLIEQTSTIEELSPGVVSSWVALAKNSREQYNDTISKMPKDMQDKINEITAFVRGDLSVKDAVKQLGEDAVKQLQISDKFEEAGKNWIRGITAGINNKLVRQEALNSMYGFGVDGLNAIKQQAWNEHSPSKKTEEAAINLLKGITIGIDKEKEKTINKMLYFGKDLINKFNGIMNYNLNSLEDIPNVNANIKRNVNMALQPKILQPNIVINTQQLNNNEMNRIIDTVNRRFGMQI